jgi:hypothetical protein
MEKPPTDFDLELNFIRQNHGLLIEVERYCSHLIQKWHEQYHEILKYKEESLKQTLDEGERYNELVRLKREAIAERIKAKDAEYKAKLVEQYRKMKFSDLVKDYLGHYMRVKISHTSMVPEIETEHLNIIEQEVKEFRSQAEQEEFNSKVNKLKEAKCAADFRALGI